MRVATVCLAILFAGLPAFLSAQERPPLVYEVQSGDTLIGISERYLEQPSAWPRLQTLNEVRNPRRLPIGLTLKLPRDLLRFDAVDLRVAAFSGPVQLSGSATAVGARLSEGDTITTGPAGYVTFQADFGGRISMPSNSRARLVRARRYLLDNTLDVDFAVDRGRGNATSPTLNGQDELLIRTPQAVTAVRGTGFRVAYDEEADRSGTEVVEGAVGVTAGDEAVQADAGFGVSTTAAGLGEPEALLPPPPFIDPGAIQTGEALSFRLAPEASASSHRVQIARDAGFLDIVSGQIITGDEVSFDGLPNGRYFVRGRAISPSGLEGLSEAYSFRRKRFGVSASVREAALADGFLFEWLAIGSERANFAFQLWKADEPRQLLVDETGLTTTALVLTDLEPGRYQWRVAAIEAEPEGLLKVWGEAQSLTVSD